MNREPRAGGERDYGGEHVADDPQRRAAFVGLDRSWHPRRHRRLRRRRYTAEPRIWRRCRWWSWGRPRRWRRRRRSRRLTLVETRPAEVADDLARLGFASTHGAFDRRRGRLLRKRRRRDELRAVSLAEIFVVGVSPVASRAGLHDGRLSQ